MTVVLSAVVFGLGLSGGAQEVQMQARIDVSGMGSKIGLLVVSHPQGGSGRIATWNEDPADNKRYAVFQMPASNTQWRKMVFSFMPMASGKVEISLKGMWSQIDGITQRNWIRFDDVSVENASLENGGFEKIIGDRPHDWQLREKDGFKPTLVKGKKNAHSGEYALETTHDQCAVQSVEVKADTIVKVTAWQMASPDF